MTATRVFLAALAIALGFLLMGMAEIRKPKPSPVVPYCVSPYTKTFWPCDDVDVYYYA